MEIKNTLIELKRDKNDLGVNGEEGLGWLNVCQLSYARKVFNKNRQQGKKKATFTRIRTLLKTLFQGAGESVSKEISGSVLVPVWRHVSFKMASKVFIEEVDKVFEFLTDILFRFLGFGDVKILIVTENQTLVPFWNETSSGVLNLKDSFLSSSKLSEHSYRPVTLLRAGAQRHWRI